MPFEDARSHFEDILGSIRIIERFVLGMDLNAYRLDEKTQSGSGTKVADHQRSGRAAER
jgi:uncharacterized protein with HEPN domain